MAAVKKATKKAQTEAGKRAEDVPLFRSRAERNAAGKALRETVVFDQAIGKFAL
jgi:hypothetical protein